MDNIEYKSNSNISKERQKEEKNMEKRAEKVVKGNVSTKPKNKFNKLAGEIISEDAKNVKSYVLGEVLIPTIKKAISDIITNGIDIILYGETRGSRRNDKIYDRVSYRKFYANDDDLRPRLRTTINSYSYNDIKFDCRSDAEEVLDRMDELMSTYGLVRVADLYDLVGDSGNYTDNMYGWFNIRNAEIVRVRDGYKIRLPRAVPID